METRMRWMIKADLPRILEIESQSFSSPWSELQFVTCLRQSNVIGMVAERDGNIVGFVIYALFKKRIEVLNLTVATDHRRTGVGTAIIDKLKAKLSHAHRGKLCLYIRETNLPGQKFFRRLGFFARGIEKDFWDDVTEDAYFMQYELGIFASA